MTDESGTQKKQARPIKVAMLLNEFFDGTLKKNHNMFGGYGMLARHYIAEFLPESDLDIVTILGFNDGPEFDDRLVDGRKRVVLLPQRKSWPRLGGFGRILNKLETLRYHKQLRKYLNGFDVFLSIETMSYGPELLQMVPRQKLILYIQDPRPKSEWEELDSCIATDDGSPRPDESVRAFYRQMIQQNRLVAISQGESLNAKAKDLYRLPEDFPVKLVRNPVTVDEGFDLTSQIKEDGVLFLGRLDPVKRPWIAMEIARRMPAVQFYFLGKFHDPMVPYIIQPYRDLPNVHLLGHQSGDVKTQLLRKCKILLNTSIHEAIPVSFLEALAYGTLLVSCQNPDSITERFGAFTGRVLGDGREQTDLFVRAISGILADEDARRKKAEEAIAYVKREHNLAQWTQTMREIIRASVNGDQ